MNNIIEINDITASELDVYARTSEVQLLRYYEPKPGLFIAESPKVIERALNAGYEPISFLVEHKDLEGEAKELLENTTMKNYEIAEKVGFSDPHYFGISFKKMTGYTPTEYAREKRR